MTTEQALRKGEYSAGGPWVTKRVFQPFASKLAIVAIHFRITPNQISLTNLVLNLVGTWYFFQFEILVAWLYWATAYLCDCTDGQVARSTHSESMFGAWFDKAVDIICISSKAAAICAIVARELGFGVILISAFLFSAGQLLAFYTSDFKRRAEVKGENFQKKPSIPKSLVSALIDAPVVDLFLCITLAASLHIFAAYLIGIGLLCVIAAVAVAIINFRAELER